MGSTFLFAEPSVWEGVARAFDFGDTLTEFNSSNSPAQADFLALFNDWQTIGDDVRSAVKLYSPSDEQQKSTTHA